MIVTKGGIAFPISRNVVFAIVLLSVILVASTAAVTYAVLSAQGKIGSSGRIIAIGVKANLSAEQALDKQLSTVLTDPPFVTIILAAPP